MIYWIQTGHQNWVRDLVVHPQGIVFYSVSDDRSIRCWDIPERKMVVQVTDAHPHFVSTVTFPRPTVSVQGSHGDNVTPSSSISAPILITGGVDGDIRCWGPR